MGWASATIDRLRQGQAVTLRPRGHSMAGRVNDGDLVTVEPLGERDLQVGDIVLVRLHGREYLYLGQGDPGALRAPPLFGWQRPARRQRVGRTGNHCRYRGHGRILRRREQQTNRSGCDARAAEGDYQARGRSINAVPPTRGAVRGQRVAHRSPVTTRHTPTP